jgi:hypothetical protein
VDNAHSLISLRKTSVTFFIQRFLRFFNAFIILQRFFLHLCYIYIYRQCRPFNAIQERMLLSVQYIGLESISVSPGRSPGHLFTNLWRFRRKKGNQGCTKNDQECRRLSLEVARALFFGLGPSVSKPGPSWPVFVSSIVSPGR